MVEFVADLEAASSRLAAAAGAASILGAFLGDTREGGAAYALAHAIEDAKAAIDGATKAAMTDKPAAALWSRWQELDAAIAVGRDDEAARKLSAEQADLERRIADAPAASLRDLEAKVALMRSFLTAGDAHDGRDVALVDGLAADLRRMMADRLAASLAPKSEDEAAAAGLIAA